MDGSPLSGFEFAAMAGLHAEYPALDLNSLLNARGRNDLDAATGQCAVTLLSQFSFRTLASDSTVAVPLASPDVTTIMQQNSLGAIAPSMPVYDYHADTDEVVPANQDDALTRTWCRAGATVEVVRDPIGEHTQEAVRRNDSALNFLAARFAGQQPRTDCPSA